MGCNGWALKSVRALILEFFFSVFFSVTCSPPPLIGFNHVGVYGGSDFKNCLQWEENEKKMGDWWEPGGVVKYKEAVQERLSPWSLILSLMMKKGFPSGRERVSNGFLSAAEMFCNVLERPVGILPLAVLSKRASQLAPRPHPYSHTWQSGGPLPPSRSSGTGFPGWDDLREWDQ